MASAYRRSLARWPLLTNIATAVPLMVLGDLAAQRSEWKRRIGDSKAGQSSRPDLERTLVMAAYSGLVFTPLFFNLYKVQDRIFKGPSKLLAAVEKAGFSWVVGGFPANAAFLTLTTTAEMKLFKKSTADGKPLSKVLATKMEQDLPRIMLGSLIWWSPINIINFMLTPPQYRIAVASMAALVWNTFLSLIQHHVYNADGPVAAEKKKN